MCMSGGGKKRSQGERKGKEGGRKFVLADRSCQKMFYFLLAQGLKYYLVISS